MDYKENPTFSASFQAADRLMKVDLADPAKDVIGSDSSLAALMQSFVNTQAQTNLNLIQFLGQQAAGATESWTDVYKLKSMGNRVLMWILICT